MRQSTIKKYLNVLNLTTNSASLRYNDALKFSFSSSLLPTAVKLKYMTKYQDGNYRWIHPIKPSELIVRSIIKEIYKMNEKYSKKSLVNTEGKHIFKAINKSIKPTSEEKSDLRKNTSFLNKPVKNKTLIINMSVDEAIVLLKSEGYKIFKTIEI